MCDVYLIERVVGDLEVLYLLSSKICTICRDYIYRISFTVKPAYSGSAKNVLIINRLKCDLPQ